MTSADLLRIRERAAADVTDRHSRQQLIARIRRGREDVNALANEVERLTAIVLAQGEELLARDLAVTGVGGVQTEVEELRAKVAGYEKRLEREWSPGRGAK